MKICYVGDSRSVHTRRWVGWFAKEHEVILVRTHPDDGPCGVKAVQLPTSAPVPGERLVRSVLELRSLLRSERPDVLHAHYINEAGWIAAATRWRPFVLTAWGSDVYRAPSESRIARLLNPWAARQADFVTCDSSDQLRRLEAWRVPEGRLDVIGWGVDTEAFHPGADRGSFRERYGIPSSASVVLSPRQWLPNSQIDLVISAFERLPGKPWLVLKRLSRFEDAYASDVEATLAASVARDRILVIDEIAESDLPGLYAAADCVVSLCITDGTPVSVLEAMASGCGVVALDHPSLREWISPPGGILVGEARPDPVAESLADMLQRVARSDAGAQNVRTVAARADRAREMARMEAVYTALAEGNSPPATVSGVRDAVRGTSR